jgi:beta-fructofuranosidase
MENSALPPNFASDPHRPRYHFMPPSNWMNDPNGPLYHAGRYHLFYQHNPRAAAWGDYDNSVPAVPPPSDISWGSMHWGHAVSTDLVNWRHLPIALTPSPDGPDKNGCFSGCAVVNEGTPTLIYTGVSPECQCLAVSHDGMRTWQKDARNPIIAGPPPGWQGTDFRDPCVWQEGDEWFMLIGAGVQDSGGAALLYRSDDLIHWTYMHPFCLGDRSVNGEIWECPDLFTLGAKSALLVSPIPLGKTLSLLGIYRERRFIVESQSVVDYGDYYAAKSFEDGEERRILWGWVPEGRSVEAQKRAGWAGAMSLPRILSLRPDGTVGQRPAPEFHGQRHLHRSMRGVTLNADGPALFPEYGVHGAALEIVAQFAPGAARQVGLTIRRAPDRSEQTHIYYDAVRQLLVADRNQASLDPDTARHEQSGPLHMDPSELLTLHVFVDNSLVEVYANGRACLTTRIYPTRRDSLQFAAYGVGGPATLTRIDAWAIYPAKFEGP